MSINQYNITAWAVNYVSTTAQTLKICRSGESLQEEVKVENVRCVVVMRVYMG
jgi:hypothetical protein